MDLMSYVHEDWYKDRLEEVFVDEEAFLDIDGFLCVRLKNTAGCAVFSLVLCSRSLSSRRLLNGNLGWSFGLLFFKGDCENAIF